MRPSSLQASFLLVVAALLLQLPLILNPGYFSHDELQWASWSVGRAWSDVPWARLSDWKTFQYRPLTFNIWMQLSRWFFDTPFLMHAACALIGAFNAVLLNIWMRQLGATPRAAFIACLIWVLNPYAMLTHGWVGTLADSLWVAFALTGIVAVQSFASLAQTRTRVNWQAAIVAFVLTAVSLLCKEAALALPAAFLISWYCLGRKSTHLMAGLASSLAVVIYLCLRLQPMLAGAETAAAYSLSTPAPMHRWAEYLLFPALLTRAEPRALLLEAFGTRHWLSIVTIATMLAILLIRNWRMGLLWLLAPLAALVPVLLLPASFSHYAYGASAVAALLLCLSAPSMAWLGRSAMILWLTLTVLHGLQIAGKLHWSGRIQAVLLNDIAALRSSQPGVALRIRSQQQNQQSIIMRSLSGIPTYRGVVWGNFVVPVGHGDATATHQMNAHGHIEHLRERE